MELDVREEPIDHVGRLAEVPTAFAVDSVLEVSVREGGLGGFTMTEVPVDEPWVKDYDVIAGGGPSRWSSEFDVGSWGLLTAWLAEDLIGGAVVAYGSPGMAMLEGRADLAVLWDIRVAPAHRTRGVGTRLFTAAVEWARERGCVMVKVETQNINVAACRFYARMGCTLGAISLFAYPNLPHEAQLIWYRPT